ncbi:MAG: hypothetical protein DMD35_14015 [Gemmatimonadetes bacterium]|nr:MAG: hypothetical protein DMD35_14015 [Gemmatimonadota bacterium]
MVSRSIIVMLPTRLFRVVALALATAAVACGDPTRPKATIANLALSYSVYGLTTAPPATSNAIDLYIGPTHADASFAFDVALDRDATGKILVYPVRAVAGPLSGVVATRVGLQTVSGSFESVREAPQTGYDTIGVKTITPGTVVVAELLDLVSGRCTFSLNGLSTYAKFVVDSVAASTGRYYIRSVGNANCGYRSLVPDSIPTF